MAWAYQRHAIVTSLRLLKTALALAALRSFSSRCCFASSICVLIASQSGGPPPGVGLFSLNIDASASGAAPAIGASALTLARSSRTVPSFVAFNLGRVGTHRLGLATFRHERERRRCARTECEHTDALARKRERKLLLGLQLHTEQRLHGVGDEARVIDARVKRGIERREHDGGVKVVLQRSTQLGEHTD